jgi:dihydrofolate reductase
VSAGLAVIAAIARNRVIGADNRLPWHLPEDLKRFKALTLGHPVIMGRRTWESLGRPLPGRRNMVISRDPAFRAPGAEVFSGLDRALRACGDEQPFVIGGAALYEAALPLARWLYLTEIDAEFAGDTRFPRLDGREWIELSRERHRAADGLAFDFVVFQRAQPPIAPPRSGAPDS